MKQQHTVIYAGLTEMLEIHWDEDQQRVVITHSVPVPVDEGWSWEVDGTLSLSRSEYKLLVEGLSKWSPPAPPKLGLGIQK